MRRRLSLLFSALALAAGLAHAEPTCTGTILVLEPITEDYAVYPTQTGCVVTNPDPGASIVVTTAYTSDPTYVSTPVTATVNDYQTTLTAVLNGGTTVFDETYDAPFNDPSVQNAILTADGLLTTDGATFGSPFQLSTSTILQSSVLTDVPTSPTLDLPTLISCAAADGVDEFTCSGVMVTGSNPAGTVTFGPAEIMIGPNSSDEFDVSADQEDINLSDDLVYTIDQNAVTTDTYLTTSSYQIDGTSNVTPTPEPGTWVTTLTGLIGCGLALASARRQRSKSRTTGVA